MSILEMRGIKKAFYGNVVLDGVDLVIEKGETHALLGENGAGKTTLMNILTGVHPLDHGSVLFDGKDITGKSIRETEAAGIAFVHQELNLFNDLLVYENIFFNNELKYKGGRLNKRAMIAKCQELFEELGVSINPTAKVDHLNTSEKQLLEISKAICFDAKLLILDEPTTALSNAEIDHLFGIVNRLKATGKSFIFISHKMPEIFTLADNYTVLRNGKFISTGKIADVTPNEVTGMMVGGAFSNADLYERRELGEVVVKLENYSGPGFRHVNMEVRKGEVVGITGLQGCGSSEMMQCMFGHATALNGKLTVFGKKVPAGSIHAAMKHSIALLASNRKENSVLADLSILENQYLSEHELHTRHQHIHKAKEIAAYEKYKKLLSTKAESHAHLITSLSGGNQQKVFIARWLNTDAEILLLDNPTQGIDVGAKAEIYKLINELAKQGKTIFVNTLEIPELQKVADRCVIFYDGEIIKTLPHEEIDEHTVMAYSTNAVNGMGGEKHE